MLTERQTELLKLIVESYIKSAKPVSSKALCETLYCSSATVRNEMSALEQFNLIEKTHISSGRVPSDKGYRYYVDNIMSPKELSGEDMLKLQQIFSNNALVLSDAISKSMQIVSELTNYTAVVLGNSSFDNKVAKIEVVPIAENKMIAIIITDKGHVENRNISISEDISLTEIKQAVELINKLIMEPEFNDVNKIRRLLNKFEDKSIIRNIKEDDDEIKVYIGSENMIDDDVSVIKTYYYKDGEEGTIALIGPKRMEYAKAEALLNYIKQNIDR